MKKVSDHIAQFLITRNLSTADIQIVVGLVRELEAVLRDKEETIEAARTALMQQTKGIRALADAVLARQGRLKQRELQGEAGGDRQGGVADSSKK